MARQAKTLYERVLANSFRADRYGKLLAGPPLPARVPAGLDARIWQHLRELQDDYTREPRLVRPETVATVFSKTVRALHGGRQAWWLLKPEPPPRVAPLEFDWTPTPMPDRRTF